MLGSCRYFVSLCSHVKCRVAQLQYFRVMQSLRWESMCMNKLVCLLFCPLSFLRETVLCVVGLKHCENSLCWVGMYIKLMYELISHFSKLISLLDNCSRKKDLCVFWAFYIHYENPRCREGYKGGIQSLFRNIGKSELDSVSEYTEERHLRVSPASVPWYAPMYLYLIRLTFGGHFLRHVGGLFDYFVKIKKLTRSLKKWDFFFKKKYYPGVIWSIITHAENFSVTGSVNESKH